MPIHKTIEEADNQNCITGDKDHIHNYLKTAIAKAKATSVDIIVSFIMEYGVRLLEEDLIQLANKMLEQEETKLWQ